MRVRLSAEARAYLLKERAYLHARSIPAASAFIARMRKARENLGRFQEIGFGPDRLPIPGARRLIVGEYILDYDIHDDLVLVSAISPSAKPVATMEYDDDHEEDPDDTPEGPGGP